MRTYAGEHCARITHRKCVKVRELVVRLAYVRVLVVVVAEVEGGGCAFMCVRGWVRTIANE